MRSNNNFVYHLVLITIKKFAIMYPGRSLLLPFDSYYSLYGYCLAGIVFLAILQEYIM